MLFNSVTDHTGFPWRKDFFRILNLGEICSFLAHLYVYSDFKPENTFSLFGIMRKALDDWDLHFSLYCIISCDTLMGEICFFLNKKLRFFIAHEHEVLHGLV